MSRDRTGSGGALEAVKEESRIQTAVSEMTKLQMSMDSALQLDNLEAAMAADKEEEKDVFVVDWDDVLLGLLPLIQDALASEETEVRRNALIALRRGVSVGEVSAMPKRKPQASQ